MYTVQTLAKHLNVTERTVLNWIQSKQIECVRENEKFGVISEASVDEFLSKNPQYCDKFTYTGNNGYTLKQFAKKYGFDRNSIYRWISDGRLKTVTAGANGRMHIIPKEEALRFIAEAKGPERTGIETKENNFYTVPELAKYSGINAKTLYQAIYDGRITASKDGHTVKIKKEEAERYLTERKPRVHKTRANNTPEPEQKQKYQTRKLIEACKPATIADDLDDLITACEMVVECLKNIRSKM